MNEYIFNCNGNNTPAYSCNKPNDNSGEYVKVEDIVSWLERKRDGIKATREEFARALKFDLKDDKDNPPKNSLVKLIFHWHKLSINDLPPINKKVALYYPKCPFEAYLDQPTIICDNFYEITNKECISHWSLWPAVFPSDFIIGEINQFSSNGFEYKI